MSTARSTVCRPRVSRGWKTNASRSSILPGSLRWPGPPPGHSETNREVYRIAAAAPYLHPPVVAHWRRAAMSDRNLIPISVHPKIGRINEAEYFRLYERSLADPDGFWGEQGRRLDWVKPYTKVGNASFTGDVAIHWYEDGTLNASYNCIDRHLGKRAAQPASLWEGDDPGEDRRVTYRELHDGVSRLANALKAKGVKKGDRV